MSDEKALGRQAAPHRRLRIGLLLLIPDGVVDSRKVSCLHPTPVMDGDIRQPHILDRIFRQTCDRTPHRASVTDPEMRHMHAVNATHMVNRNQFSNRIVITRSAQSFHRFTQLIATPTIAQADENGRLGTLDGKV